VTATLSEQDAARLRECLSGDGVAVLPTDTVYGLACNPGSERAIRRMYELKGRPPVKPAAVMFFALDPALRALPELGPRTRAALGALLPGPVTLLLGNPRGRFPLASDPDGAAAGSAGPLRSATLGVRVPLLEGPLGALSGVGVPALQSSANLSGGPDPRRLQDVPAALREGADLVLDGGDLPGTASTVIDLHEYEQTGSWRIVREGPLERPALERLLG
jgi:L-threonylcarbamoyladenylate synthase